MTEAAWQVRWTDGFLVHGSSASEVLAEIGGRMWDPPQNIKATLAYRAWSYFRVNVDESLPDDEFLKALGEAGLCEVISNP